MADALKDRVGGETVRRLGEEIAAADPSFDAAAFAARPRRQSETVRPDHQTKSFTVAGPWAVK